MRIVCLLPSATEALCFVGGRGRLIGRTHECDEPATLAGVPAVTRGPAVYDGPGADPAAGRGLYRLNEPLLTGLRPDVIVTSPPGAAAGVEFEAVDRAAGTMSPRPRIVTAGATTIEGMLDDLIAIADAAGLRDAGLDAAVGLREGLYHVQEHVPPFLDGPRVGFVQAAAPIRIAGWWIVQLIERAGGRHPLNPTVADADAGAAEGFQQAARRAGAPVSLPPEVFAACAPDRLIVCLEGGTVGTAARALLAAAGRDWFESIPAVRACRSGEPTVALVDGRAFHRPGPRLLAAFGWLVGWLHDRPELMPPDFPWRPWTPGGMG